MSTTTASLVHPPFPPRWRNLPIAIGSLVASAITCSWLPPSAGAAPSFGDIQSHWAKACVDHLATQNKLNGYPDGSFRPERRLTRAEYAVLMLNSFPGAANAGATNRPIPNFKDLPPRHWAYRALRSAYQRGIFVGYPDGTIRPDQSISRAESIAVLYRLVSPNGPTDPSIPYVGVESIPRFPIPQNPQATLAELFGDAAEVPTWAQPSLAAAAAGFMVVDYPFGNTIRAQEPTTRAEAAAFLCQAAGRDGLVPTEAIAGYRFFTQSAELKKLLLAQTNGQQGWFDTQRERAVIATAPPGWRIIKIGKRSENRVVALFENDDSIPRSGFFDGDGELVIPPGQFHEAGDFSEGLAAVNQAGTSGFIDLSGKLVIPLQFSEVKPFSEGLAAARPQQDETAWGFIDISGAWVIPPQPYVSVSLFSGGLARIEIPDPNRFGRSLFGFIDQTGKVAIAPQFVSADSFSEGLASVGYQPENSFEIRSAYIDRSGQRQLEIPEGEGIAPFSEGLAARSVEKNLDPTTRDRVRQYGFINKTGQWAIEPQDFFGFYGSFLDKSMISAISAGPFRSGFAAIRQGDRFGVINRQGRPVVPPIYSDIQDISNGYAYVNYGGVWVDYVAYYNNDVPQYERVMWGGRWGYVKLPSSYGPDSPYSDAFPGPEP